MPRTENGYQFTCYPFNPGHAGNRPHFFLSIGSSIARFHVEFWRLSIMLERPLTGVRIETRRVRHEHAGITQPRAAL